MTDGRIIISTWKRICLAVDCTDKRTAKKRLDALGVRVRRVQGLPMIDGHELKKKMQ